MRVIHNGVICKKHSSKRPRIRSSNIRIINAALFIAIYIFFLFIVSLMHQLPLVASRMMMISVIKVTRMTVWAVMILISFTEMGLSKLRK